MHNDGVFVHYKSLFLVKYLLLWIKICSFAPDFLLEIIYKQFKKKDYVRN